MRTMSVPNKASMLALAIALAAGPSPAAAQSFQGSVDSATGASVDQSTPGQTNVTVSQQQAVINWTATNNPADGTIIFQPEGTSATFVGASNFAVLNRVTPGTAGNAIFMGGNITSLIGESVGGTVFFYSPNGIIIGQNASINVGSLGLTTLPIADDGQGNWMSGFGTATPQVSFGQATDANSFVRTNAMIDGSINAFGSGSYVALVAPIVQHSGIIRTDTAAALVAAEAATITFSPDGLFNIQVTVGTDAATGIDVDGGTIERRNLTEGSNHYAYLAAVAKNDAVEMLVRNGGSVGFDTATSAAVEDNVVVLSGGRQISSGQTDTVVGGQVDLEIDGATFTTDVEADISGAADINSDSGNTSFGLDPTSTSLNLLAGANSIVTATNGNTLSIAGSLVANLDKTGTTASPTGNTLRLTANGTGSALSIGGNAFLTSRVFGAGEGEPAVDAVDVTGGTVIVQNGAGSTIDIAGSLGINVDASGGSVAGGGAAAGSATGGTAQIVANGGSGAALTVTGAVDVSASGTGGAVSGDCLADCGVIGGNGTGGAILVQASTISGSQLNLGATVDVNAIGEGGPGDIAAGSGTGGNIQLVSGDAGAITIAGNLTADASATGGFGMESTGGGGNGGSATGGFVGISFSGAASSIDLQGTSLFDANAFGGNGYAAGGSATGGWVNLQAGASGSLGANFVGASADASGGASDIFNTGSGIAGGTGTAGRAWLQAAGGGSAIVTDLSLSANGFGGDSSSGVGGAGIGGYVIASANNASLAVRATADLEGLGVGGHSSDDAGTGGLGTGGQADIFAANNGTVTLTGFTSLDTTGRGGSYFNSGSTGGNGVGGIIFFQANDGGALDAVSDVDLTANGFGGFCNDCNDGGTGGDGTGGMVTIQSFGGVTTLLTVAGEVNATAIGFGSSGFAGPGGDGQGGTVRLGVHTGATANFLGNLLLNASGNGGWQTNGGVAGNGSGGLVDAFVNASGGTLNVDGFAEFTASGFGGITEGTDGTAGDGFGGIARFLALGGTANFDSDLVLHGEGYGGSAGTEGFSGTGGDGTGNIARIQAAGGDITIGGTASVSASGYGGAGTTGGSGAGGGDFFTNTGGAHIVATNGDIVIGGAAVAMADGFGADGIDGGDGGDGTGGWASIHAANGDGGPSSISIQGIEAAAFASASGYGGAGGDGLAGINGESGGTGTNGGAGNDGGDGGTGTGGVAAITASAGNGTLNISLGFVDATGSGGAGGNGGIGGIGGNGDGGAGGNGGAGGLGGAGGAAFGGLAVAGTQSGTAQAAGSNLGTANLGTVEFDVSAEGGAGGAGGLGGGGGFGTPNGVAGADGNGGAGGNAESGTALLQVEGGTANIGSANLVSIAAGGDGGSGAVQGNGGDAESDEARVLVTNRAGDTTLRGTLSAGQITGSVFSTGGAGALAGIGLMEGGSGFIVENGDATIDFLDFNIVADGQIPDLATDSIAIVNGTVQVNGTFSFNTSGVASVYADSGTLTAGTFEVVASNFIHDPDRPFPASVGVIGADTFNLTTGQDLVVDAHLISTSSLNLSAPGMIEIRDATSGDQLTLNAGSTISGGTMTATNLITADAASDIGLNFVISGSNIDIQSSGGTIATNAQSAGGSITLGGLAGISTGDLTAAGSVQANSASTVAIGDIGAGGSVDVSAGPLIDVGDISAGGFIALGADTILGGNMTAGGFIDLFAGGPATIVVGDLSGAGVYATSIGDITTGTIASTLDVDLQSFDGSITTLGITAATDVMLDATGTVATGNIDSGGTVVANGSSLSLGDVSGNILNLTSTVGDVATGNLSAFGSLNVSSADDFLFGSITAPLVNLNAPGSIIGGFIDSDSDITAVAGLDIDVGDLTAGGFDGEVFQLGDIQLTAGGDITTGAASATGFIDMLATAGSIVTGNLAALTTIDLDAGGGIGFGDVTADDLDFDAGGAVTGGNIVAGTMVGGEAQGAVSLGNISVGIQQPGGPTEDGFAVGIASATSITVGDVAADEAIGFATFGNLDAGDLNAGTDVMTLIGGDTTIASIITLNTGRTHHGDAQMFIDAGGPDNFDPSLVFGATPVRSGGSYTVTGPISTGQVQVAAAAITTGAINAPVGIDLDAAGDIATGALTTAGNIQAFSNGSILTGNVNSSGGELLLTAGDDVTIGTIDVASDAAIHAQGNVTLGAATVGGGLQVDAGGNLTTASLSAAAIDAQAGGLATLNGMWQSGNVELWSNDIAIATNGGIDGGVDGTIRLVSTNAAQALIGDGLTGSGYALGNAEFGRLSAGNVQIAARGDASAAIDMMIGDLNVTGPNAGSKIEDPFGALLFATGDPATQTAGGVIRIVGDLTATGFADTNAIEFYAGRFELDAATGLLEITGSGTDLGGELYIEADRIHVAEGAILDQLAANAQYAGYQDDLNAPAAVQRPDGVIRAGGIDVFPTEAVLVQNTGTAETPAGFLTFGEGPLFSESEAPAGPIELIINGQLMTEGGTLTGVAVRDFLVDESNIGLFTENSTINGCLLTGPCGDVGQGPFPPGFTPTPGIQDEITLIDDGLLPPPEFGNEDFIDDNVETTIDGATSPITPPNPLFDTSALGAKSDVDDPVSGSGNPALMETGPAADTLCPAGSSQPTVPCKEEKQP